MTRRPVTPGRLLLVILLLLTGGLFGAAPAGAAPEFSVLAFYNGTYDAAHIAFTREVNRWFPEAGRTYGFSYEATTDWNRLTSIDPGSYQVVLFLDDTAQTAEQRDGFRRYLDNGGAWFGFHVAAFTAEPSTWDWYYNDFLGSGAFASNTWGPTTATVRTGDAGHPATRRLPATFTSSVSEWYAWGNELRRNPDIDVLASVDPSSFPLGTDPDQSWYSGDYPLVWTNTRYRMLYANFGHEAMNYAADVPTSATFGSAEQNRMVIDGLLWLGGAAATDRPADPIDPEAWQALSNRDSGLCVGARGGGTGDGTVLEQGPCAAGAAQEFRFPVASGPNLRVASRGGPVLDVTDSSTSDGAPVQLWTAGDGENQQWQAVAEDGGTYHLVNRHSGKCLAAPSGAQGAGLVQRTCAGGGDQSFGLVSRG